MERIFSAPTEKEVNGSSSIKASPGKNASSKQSTIRIEIKLFEPTADAFPEFNFSRLVNFEKKKQKKLTKLSNGSQFSDPFGEGNEDDEVARMAHNLEARYGQNSDYAKSNSAKVNKLDTMDRGAGYDENDSFIDNTEAYDELIPDEIETDRGGFYINSGALEFKKLSNYERPGDEIKMPKAKKRILSTSSEGSASEAEEEQKPSKENDQIKKSGDVTKPKSPKSSHVEKKQKTAGTSSSDEMGMKINKIPIKEKEKEKEKVKEVKAPKKIEKEDAASDSSKDNNKKVIKTTTVKDMLRCQRDNLRKMELGKDAGGTTNSDDSDSIAVNGESSSSGSEDEEDKKINGVVKEAQKDVPLPDQLPPILLECISKLKEIALQNVSTLSKNNFFDAKVKDLLLKVDIGARSCGANARSQILDHLEKFLPCTKQTLNSRIRKLKQQGDEAKNKTELDRFKQMVNALMPDMEERYDRELALAKKARMVQEIVGGSETLNRDPKRKFLWTDSLRVLLWELMGKRKNLFKQLQIRKESEDDFLTKYIRETLLPIWPPGWMKKDLIVKEFERRKIDKKDEKNKIPPNKVEKAAKLTSKPVLAEASKVLPEKTELPDKLMEQLDKSYSEVLKVTSHSLHSAKNSSNSSNVRKNEVTVTTIQPKIGVTAVNLVNSINLASLASNSASSGNSVSFVNSSSSGSSGSSGNSAPKHHKQKSEKSETKPAHSITSLMSSPNSNNSSSSKRASDHSISSIISSSPVPAEVNHSALSNAKPTTNHPSKAEKTNRPFPSNEKKPSSKVSTSKPKNPLEIQPSLNTFKPLVTTNEVDSDSEVEFIAEFNQKPATPVLTKFKNHSKVKESEIEPKVEMDDIPSKKIKLGEESEEAEEAFDVNNVFRDLSFINMTEVKEDSKKSTNSEKSQFGNSPAASTFNSTSNASKKTQPANHEQNEHKSANNNVHYTINNILINNQITRHVNRANSFDSELVTKSKSFH